MEAICFSELHDATAQKTALFIVIAERISNFNNFREINHNSVIYFILILLSQKETNSLQTLKSRCNDDSDDQWR
jgi:hypothetical protein